jgi:acetyl esterase
VLVQPIKGLGVKNSLMCAAAALLLAGCQAGSPFRDPTARSNDDMAAVIHAYQALGAKPVHTLSVQQARAQPTLADAVKAVMQHRAGMPAPAVKTTDIQVTGAAGPLQARLYDAMPGHAHQPVILYFHGGGWVTGGLDTHDASDRALAVQAKAMVLSVAYRLAPEAKFPAAHDDAFAAYRWLLANGASLGADPRRIAVAGESAGGNLAINTAIAARNMHVTPPVHELVIYPIAGVDTRTRSYVANKDAIPLGRDDILWGLQNLTRGPGDLADPRIDLIGRADLRGLPPTTVISAEIDPLESEAVTLTLKLQRAGVDVSRVEYQGTTHDFFGTGAAVARAREAEAFASTELDRTFQKIGAPPQAVNHQRPGHDRASRQTGK